MMEWISVKERLPEDDPNIKKHIEGEEFGFLSVLVYNGVVKESNRFFCKEAKFGLHKTEGWEWSSTNVTHWMPLPKEPSENRTNADRIRSMSDERLARFIYNIYDYEEFGSCSEHEFLDWLKQPVKEDRR